MRTPKAKCITAVLLAVAGFALQQARADVMSILNVGNPDLTGGGNNPPYGTVTVSLSGNTATITFTAAASYLFGGVNAVDVNVNGAFTLGTITDNGAGTFSQDMSGMSNVDGFGDFNLRLNDTDGFGDAASIVSFTITGSWANAASVLAFNSGGGNGGPSDAAAHIFPLDGSKTGFAAETGPFTNVPDGGATAMLLGMALTAVGALRRFAIS